MNLISVITINYNNLLGLEKTLKSVSNQSYNNFECIVIDGASTDGSVACIEAHQSRITYWVSEKDQGVYQAMNKGIRAAKGDFVLFMNSGDCFFSCDVLEKAASFLNFKQDLVYGDAVLENPITGLRKTKIHPKDLPFSYFYKDTICHQACFIKKKLFDQFFYYNETYKIKADWEFFLYMIYIAKVPFLKINYIICTYDTTGISSSMQYKAIAQKEREEIIGKHFYLFKQDYQELNSYSSSRFNKLKRIEKSVFWRKFVSLLFDFILIWIPTKK